MNGITNNRDTTRSQSFTYDQVNRIATAETVVTSGSHCWGEKFGYDQWANLLSIGAASSSYNGCTQENLSLSVNASNQISSPLGYVYDYAGNLTTVPAPGSASYTYNAENQVTLAQGVTYTYDGDGKRVQKSSGKLYWYGVGSDPIAESDLSGNITDEYVFFGGKRIARRDSSGNVVYYFADHLGTSRIVTNATGTILDDSDFYPFGGERVITSSSGNTYKFTGKERDSESGLDNFGARYDASTLGRFMSPDPMGGHLADPQTLNRYAYVRNNPLNLTDPTGLDFGLSCKQTKKNASTCQSRKVGTDKNKKPVYAFVQGTTGANGKFTATQIGDDGKGGLIDKTTGTGAYTANVTGSGVQLSQDGGKTSSGGVFVNGTDPTHIQGSGDLSGFSFTFTNSKMEANQTAAGTFSFAGTPSQAISALMNAGFNSMGLFGKNVGFYELRSPGSFPSGENSGHFNVKETIDLNPTTGAPSTNGDMHFGEHDPLLAPFTHYSESQQ